VTTGERFTAGTPVVLFDGRRDIYFAPSGSQSYDVTPDGRRFVMTEGEPGSGPSVLNVVVNWRHELGRRVPR
jgi:hypothetical protein